MRNITCHSFELGSSLGLLVVSYHHWENTFVPSLWPMRAARSLELLDAGDF